MNVVNIFRNGKGAKHFDAVAVMQDYFAEEEARIQAIGKIKNDMAREFANQIVEAEELPSGLKYLELNAGSGEKPNTGDIVLVNYAGYLMDGTLFDSNYSEVATSYGIFDPKREQGGGYDPIPMDYTPESRLIAGFKEGLLLMEVGDKWRLFIPSHLGYGPQGSGPIPPNADLVFDLEVVGIAE
jgi:FKBP-type peptidyl-prolyl cis-trans isomerase